MTQACSIRTGYPAARALRCTGHWLAALLLGLLLLLALSGCASGAAGRSAGAGVEPVTEFDESPQRKRARIRLELALGYFEKNQVKIALDEVKQSLAADPNFVEAHVLRGLIFMHLQDDRLTQESFERALQINPRHPDALHNYGWFQCQLGRHAEAVELFNRALAVPAYAGQARTLMASGLCLTRMGQLAQAEANFARSYELDPGNPITAYNLANLLHRRAEDQRAQFIIRRLNNSELANAETLWLGIRIERRLRNTEAMAQLAQQLGRRYPQSGQWSAHQRGAFDE